ncbi:MAG: NIL domain-containing protein [Candidatus Omnitrophica bacterium]|nr:NIL domain-containing protein [Candidatus Omnitrophota bacterium]MCF7878581.1 NIL domain-containing protein [Candidatus Omnitrophota bacterium]MCF7892651.1 NIL domain-containing protein [Candidatus Omnitrophota bacterium]
MIKQVELNIPTTFKKEPFFYNIIKNFKVIPSILEASFSTATGWAIVSFQGSSKELTRLFDYLEKKGIEVKFR